MGLSSPSLFLSRLSLSLFTSSFFLSSHCFLKRCYFIFFFCCLSFFFCFAVPVAVVVFSVDCLGGFEESDLFFFNHSNPLFTNVNSSFSLLPSSPHLRRRLRLTACWSYCVPPHDVDSPPPLIPFVPLLLSCVMRCAR